MCSEQCNAPTRLKEDYETLLAALMPEPDDAAYHLTKAEMAGYVQGSLDDVAVEEAESHLEVCAECTQAVAELRAATSEDSFAPAAELAGGREQGYGHRTGAGFLAFFTAMSRPAQFAALLLLAFALVLMTLLFIRIRNSRPSQPVIVKDEKSNQDNGNTPLPNPSTVQPPLTVHSPEGAGGEQTASPSGKELNRTDATAMAEDDLTGVEKISPALHREIVSALTTQKLERPLELAELKGTRGTLLSESGNGLPFRLLSPVGKVVQNSKPSFRWQSLAGASSYVVTVVDDKLNVVASSGTLTKTEWGDTVPLKRGGVYSWQVTALKDGQEITSPVMPAPQAKFKILDQRRNEELERVKLAFPNYHLGLGVLYTRAGLLDEAEREFQTELKSNPRSAVARKLLHSVRSMKK